MNRSTLIQEISQTSGFPEDQVKTIILSLCESLSSHLSRGDVVNLWGFGKFEPRLRKAHSKLNPLSGKIVDIPERISAVFIASGGLRERMNHE